MLDAADWALRARRVVAIRRDRVSFPPMSDSSATVPAASGSETPAALVQAVVELGTQRPIKTSQAIYNTQGVKLLEGGVTIDRSLYDRLLSHRLALPLDECIDASPSVDGSVLGEAARAATLRWPFFARVAPADAVASSHSLADVLFAQLNASNESKPARQAGRDGG